MKANSISACNSSAEALALTATELDFLELLNDLEALICLGPVLNHDLFEKLLRARMRADKRPLQHIEVHCFILSLARNVAQTKVNQVLLK